MSRWRTLSICLDDLNKLPVENITVAGNGKRYVSISTWDYKEEQIKDHDFAICVTRTPEQKKNNEEIVWIGGGIIQK